MKLIRAVLFRDLPINNSYNDVFDFLYDYDTKIEFINAYETVLKRHFVYEEHQPPTIPRSMPLNQEMSFTVIHNEENEQFAPYNNYLIAYGENDEFGVYFITDYKINNSVDKMSVTYSCVKDAWISNYFEIKKAPKFQVYERKHFENWKRIDGPFETRPLVPVDDFYSDENSDGMDYENSSSSHGTLYEYDILWERYTLDRNKLWAIKFEHPTDGTSFEELNNQYNGLTGGYICVYRPVRVFYKNSTIDAPVSLIYDWTRSGDNAIDVIIGRRTSSYMDSEYVIGVDYTFFPPFGYNLLDGQPVATNGVSGYLVYRNPGQSSWSGILPQFKYMAYAYVGDEPLNYLNRQIPISSDTFSNEPRFQYYSQCIQQTAGSPMDLVSIDRALAETKAYPYIYHTLVTDSTQIPLKCKGKISEAVCSTFLTNFGVAHRLRVVTPWGKYLDEGYNVVVEENTTEIPHSVSSYERFKTNSYNSFNIRYQNALENSTISRNIAQAENVRSGIKGLGDLATGVAMMGSGNYAGGAVMIAESKSGLDAVRNIAKTEYLYQVEQRHIKSSRDAEIADIKNRASVNYSTNSGIASQILQDRVVLYYHSAIKNEEYYTRVYLLHKYGTPRIEIGDFNLNTRTCFDFTKTKSVQIPTIGNQIERHIVESIFNKGVLKWHLENFSESYKTLNALIGNPPIHDPDDFIPIEEE